MSKITGDLVRYLHEAGLGDEDPETVLDRYHTPDYELVNDGNLLTRQRLLEHIGPARKRATGLHVEILRSLVDGDQVAIHYRLVAELRKGAPVSTEVFMFGELAPDGRLRRAVQTTRTLQSEGSATAVTTIPSSTR
jgi:hypothetical protein